MYTSQYTQTSSGLFKKNGFDLPSRCGLKRQNLEKKKCVGGVCAPSCQIIMMKEVRFKLINSASLQMLSITIVTLSNGTSPFIMCKYVKKINNL